VCSVLPPHVSSSGRMPRRLVNGRGQVIGMNTAIILGAQGIAFAVPVETVSWVVGDLIAHGRVRRAQLGLAGQAIPIPPFLAKKLRGQAGDKAKDTQPMAVGVVGVLEGGAAEEAGVRPGEAIVAADGKPVKSMDDIYSIVSKARPGDTVILTVVTPDGQGVRNARVTLQGESQRR
jgi:S1-C subfamily serine protease